MKKNYKYGMFWYLPALKKSLLIMRLTIVISLVCIIQSFALESYTQNTKISISVEKMKLEDILMQIEKETHFRFTYDKNKVDIDNNYSINIQEAEIEEVLNKLFSEGKIGYTIVNRQIVLSPASKTAALTQQKTVSGKITDSSGLPIPGVSVLIKGSKDGVVTDSNGSYFFSNIPENSILVFSFIGMTTQEISVAGKSVINVQLEDAVFGIDEVVAVGYGTQKKVNLTGSIASVKTEQLVNIPVANLSNAIAGRAPGVTVVGTSGLAGASSSIRIRGSFEEPLYVINGVIKSKADFDALDASEVESINFLKDAASSSIYGSKAGNGVVLITTKTGIIQKPVFEYKGSYSVSSPTKPIQSYTATEEIEYANQVEVTAGRPKPYGQEIYDYFKDKSYNVNDYIWNSPTVQQHNLGVRGGSDAMVYYLSLGYHTEEGSYHNLGYDRYNFRSDITANISKRFKVSFNLSGNQRNYDRWFMPYDGAEDFNVGDFFRSTFNWTRLYPFYVDAQGNPTTDTNAFPVVPGAWHPVELITNSGGYVATKYRTFDGILRFDLDLSDILDGLSTSLQAHYTGSDRNMKTFALHNIAYVFQSASTSNQFLPGPIDPTKINLHNMSQNFQNIAENVNLSNSYQLNWYLRYENTFGKHGVSAMAVYEQGAYKGKSLSGRAEQLLTTSIDQIYNTSSDAARRHFDGSESETAMASWIGRLNYTFDNKYIGEFSFRYDGNYKFAPNKRWGFFPSVSLAWRISEEQFMKDISWLSNLKLRGSYGTTGNDDVGAFLWSQTYNKSGGYVFGSSFSDGLAPGAMPNLGITWSTSKMLDAGVDFGFLDNKLFGEFDIFTRTQSDILGQRTGSTPTSLGATLPSVNYAERSWKGFEFSLGYNNKIGDVSYSVYGNMGYSIDKWDIWDEPASYTDGTYKDNWRSRIGKPANRITGYISKGIIRTQAQLDALPAGFTQNGRVPKLGYLLYEDVRGANFSEGPDGKIDGNDEVILSNNGSPRINYGLGFKLEWKGIAVNAHFQGVGAYDRMVSTRNGGGVFQVDRPYFEIWARNYWTPENPNAKYPRVSGEWLTPDVGGASSTFWIRNGAYVRLKNLDIAYTLPQKWYNRFGVNKVQIFANGTNLFYISGLKEHDPEQSTLDSYPLMRTFTGGLNIIF